MLTVLFSWAETACQSRSNRNLSTMLIDGARLSCFVLLLMAAGRRAGPTGKFDYRIFVRFDIGMFTVIAATTRLLRPLDGFR